MDLDDKITTDQLFSRTKHRKYLLIKRQMVVGVLAAIFGLAFVMKLFEPVEFFLLDHWLSRAQWKTETNVVLVPITEKSIQHMGKWPWPPERYAEVLELLSAWEARAVYIDSNFAENLPEEGRASFLEALSKRKIPFFFSSDLMTRFKKKQETENDQAESSSAPEMEWTHPGREVAKYGSFGHRELKPEKDRIFRFWQPWIKDDRGVIYSLSALTMLMDLQFDFNDRAIIRSVKRERRLIPWNRVRFETWPRVEFYDLMQSYKVAEAGASSVLSAALFQNKVVFIGLADEKNSPKSYTPWKDIVFPFEIMASIFDGLGRTSSGFLVMAPFWQSFPPFVLFAGFLIVWAGIRAGTRFWVGWVSLLGLVVLIWGAFAFFGVWFPFAMNFIFLLTAGLALFTYESIYAAGEKSVLFHLATRDGLTNLYTIRHFRLIMNQVAREAMMRKEFLSVILIDIDYFKKVNDTYGHAAGDMVIKKTAEVIESCVRQERSFKDVDFVARYGGEEFIVLLRRAKLEDAANLVAERIRNAVGQTHFEWQLKRLFVTVSLGVASLQYGENVPDTMVHRADKALYRAKENGRNCVRTEES